MNTIRCLVASTREELMAHFHIRRLVFVKEEGVFEHSDLDEHDPESIPIVARRSNSGEYVGAVRCYQEEKNTWFGGRLAVKPAHRGSGAGKALVKRAEEVVQERGCQRFLAYVQRQNVPFFKRLDWRPVGGTFEYHGIQHQTMETEWSRVLEEADREAS